MLNCKKKPLIHVHKHTSWNMKKKKRLSDIAHCSLKLMPYSTFIKTPEHIDCLLEKAKVVDQATLDWNTCSSPHSLNNFSQAAWDLWVSRKTRSIVRIDMDYNRARKIFLQTRHLLDQVLSHPPAWAMCFVFASVSLLYFSSALQMLPTQRLNVFTPPVCITSILASILLWDFSKLLFLEPIKALSQYP